ncbi:MAG: cyanophycinase [Acidobacteriota bacterium]|nr:cyanophycinase [Acidobacteriota bacterium]
MKNEKKKVFIKREFFRLLSLCLAVGWLTFSLAAQQKLVAIGGGKRPPAAIKQFVNWAGAEKSKILIITWASGVPQESFDGIKKDFAAYQIAAFENAPFAPLTNQTRQEFLAQIKNATAVFFTGGDQNRIMDVLKDEELYAALVERYAAGVVFGGTSAGTAAMTTPMMTGEANLKIIDGAKVGTRKGLGLLPNTVLDQHFIVRQRENRLFGLILRNPTLLGIGIDEDMALLVEDNRRAEVVGETQIMFVDAHNRKGAMLVHLLKAGESFDLKKRKMISKAKSTVSTGK